MDENASIETIRPNSPLFDTGRVTFNDSVEMIQAQEAVDDHEDQNLKKEKLLYDEKPWKVMKLESVQVAEFYLVKFQIEEFWTTFQLLDF